jgi:hypothetical protein
MRPWKIRAYEDIWESFLEVLCSITNFNSFDNSNSKTYSITTAPYERLL